MIVRDRVYTIDDVWRLSQLPENEHKFFYLIEGELYFMSRPGGAHGLIASLIAHFLWAYALERDMGHVTTETGYHPPESRKTLLGPDVGFLHRERAPQPFPARFVPVMPDLAVEVLSPSNTLPELRRKAEVYLRHGSALVWLVNPEDKTVEVWRLHGEETTSETVGSGGELDGEPVLPGFSLELDALFSLD
ncbi:MAG: Uma2 family endonuclease [Chloroflexota bacterium]|nr:Uma2 family endonuclease [Chloroflexota bacterium]